MIGPMPDAVDTTSNESPSATPPRAQGLEPALLLVGAGSELQEALTAALGRHGLFVETTTPEELLGATIAAAPDLILLAGDAARDGGVVLLQELSASPLTSVVPVALLQENPSVDVRLKAFRHGAVAVVARSASIDALALEIANLAREIPERASASLGQLGESTLRDFVDALARELRQGVLSVKTGDREPEVRLVLGEGRPLVELVDDFVARVRQHVVRAEPLQYEFDERPTGTVAWLGKAFSARPGAAGDLSGVPLALADPDAARADVLAQALRERGAIVMVTDLDPPPARYARLRQMDPLVLLIGASDIEGRGYELLRQMKYDPRLRWTSLLVVEWGDLIPEVGLPSVECLASRITGLIGPLRTLQRRVLSASGSVGARLESMGPAHLLRLLIEIPHGMRVEVQHRRLQAAVDIAEHLVAGVTATRPEAPGQVLQGPLALAALLQLGSGRVRIHRVAQPASTNLMGTLASALDLADREVAPIPPSLPSPGWSAPPKAGHDAAVIPGSPRLPVLEEASGGASEASGGASDGGEGTVRIDLDASARLPVAAPALALPPTPCAEDLEPGPNRTAPVEPSTDGPAGQHRARAQTVVGLGPGTGATGHPEAALLSADPFLAEMPSPNRDYETLIEGVVESPEARRAAALEAAATALEAAATGPSVGVVVASSKVRAPTEDSGLTMRMGRVLMRLRPSLGAEEARSLVVLGFVASASLVAAFVVAFAIGTLGRSNKTGSAAGSAAGVAAPAGRSESGSGPTSANGAADLGSKGGRAGVLLPAGPASENPTPSCETLHRTAKTPFQRYPGASFDQVAIGRKALVRGDIESSHVAYCRALLLDPGSKSARSEMARLLVLRRDGKAAERQARSAMALEPKSRIVRGVLGDALARLGRYDQAREAFLYESQADPTSHYAVQSLCDTMLKRAAREVQKSSWGEAERFYRRAIALDPKDARGAAGLAVALEQLGDKLEATKWARYANALGGLGPREMEGVTRVLAGQSGE